MTASTSSKPAGTVRQSKSLAATLAAAAAMFLIASLLFAFVLVDSYASFNSAWTLVFLFSIGMLILAALGSGWHARRIWKQWKSLP